MSLDYDFARKEIREFKEKFLVPAIARYDKLSEDYSKKAGAVPLLKGDPHKLLAAVDERQSLRNLSKHWDNQRQAMQSILNDYQEHFEEYLKE
jgi:hypothetical protein